MKAPFKKIGKLFLLFSVPLLSGCGGGGGLAALGLGSLFGLGGGSGTSFFGGGELALLTFGESGSIPVLHNPEPASMILMGTGMAAMAYFRSRK